MSTVASLEYPQQNLINGRNTTALISALEKLSAATTAAESLEGQSACLAVAAETEVLAIIRAAESVSARRLDLLQFLYWLMPPGDRVPRFRQFFDEAAIEDREFLKALLFRAIMENTVRSSHPERLDRYLESVRDEFAQSLFGSRIER